MYDNLTRTERYKKLYQSHDTGNILLCIHMSDGGNYGSTSLTDYDFSKMEDHKKYWDVLIEKEYSALQARAGLEDDRIAGVTMHYGFGAFAGVFADVSLEFTNDTSYCPHLITDWDSFDFIKPLYSPDRFWSRVFIESGKYISEKTNGELMVEPYPSPSPLDVANLLRGNDIFTDYFEYEEELEKFLNLATQGIIDNYKNIHDAILNPLKGTYTFGKWIPSGILLLEDAGDLSSPSNYETFGKPYTQRVFDALGGGYIHHHSLGKHQYKNIATLDGLFVEQISSDPREVRPVTYVEDIFKEVGTKVIDLECTTKEVYEYIDAIKQGNSILTVNCSDKDEAKELLAFVRSHSKIK